MEESHLLLCLIGILFVVATSASGRCPRTSPENYCRKPCKDDSDCRNSGRKKVCRCDGDCGLSCIRPGAKCKERPYEAPQNGIRITGGMKFGSTVEYKCKRGYTLSGTKVFRCSGIGKWKPWNKGRPRCRRACTFPGKVKHGRLSTKNFDVGVVVVVTCFPGYAIVGKGKVRCQSNLQWSSVFPKCEVVRCDKPDVPVNSKITRGEKDLYFYGDLVFYSCRPGYFRAGYPQRLCSEKKWSKVRFSCHPKSCGNPGDVFNGKRIGNVFTFKSNVRYECSPGYTLHGSPYRTCLVSGWDGSKASCHPKNCGPPPSLTNGYYDGTDTTYGTTQEAKCKRNYEALGGRKIRCNENGKWEWPENIICQAIRCEKPDLPPNSKLSGEQKDAYYQGDVILYTCQPGYIREGYAQRTCLHKKWSKVLFTCKPKSCGNPGDVFNGKRIGNVFTFKSNVRYECSPGYTLHGSPYRTCLVSGWDGSKASCHPKNCGPPPSLTNGYYDGTDTTYGTTQEAKCKRNYEALGGRKIRCNENGKWEWPENIICQVAYCEKPDVPPNSKLVGEQNDRFDHGYTILYNCKKGFFLTGYANRVCLFRKWSDVQFSCHGCGSPPFPANGLADQSIVYKNQDEVKYRCNDGFTLLGKPQRCTRDGWIGKVPICVQDCPELEKPQHGSVYIDRYSKPTKAIISCDHGFEIRGQQEVECRDSRWQWISSAPVCEASVAGSSLCTGCKSEVKSFEELCREHDTVFIATVRRIYKDNSIARITTKYTAIKSRSFDWRLHPDRSWNVAVPVINSCMCPLLKENSSYLMFMNLNSKDRAQTELLKAAKPTNATNEQLESLYKACK